MKAETALAMDRIAHGRNFVARKLEHRPTKACFQYIIGRGARLVVLACHAPSNYATASLERNEGMKIRNLAGLVAVGLVVAASMGFAPQMTSGTNSASKSDSFSVDPVHSSIIFK